MKYKNIYWEIIVFNHYFVNHDINVYIRVFFLAIQLFLSP